MFASIFFTNKLGKLFPSRDEPCRNQEDVSLINVPRHHHHQQQQHSDDEAASKLEPSKNNKASYSTFSNDDDNHNKNNKNTKREHSTTTTTSQKTLTERILTSWLGPRLILLLVAAIYGTNFPAGEYMDEHLPASAVTTGRFIVASLVLSPFLTQLEPRLLHPAIFSGACSGLAYITQSLALVDTNAARVSFLGAATVLVVPTLEATVDRKPMGLQSAPQTWLAAFLCFAGVGMLELLQDEPTTTTAATTDTMAHVSSSMMGSSTKDDSLAFAISRGDILALIQAVGFGTSCWMNNKMLRTEPQQFLPVTAVLMVTTCVLAIVWSLADGWMWRDSDWLYDTLPGLLLDRALWPVAGAMLWTGLVSTSFNYSLEMSALGRLPASEASVILASEPLWAALFAAVLYQTGLDHSDAVGGLLIVSACMVNAILKPRHFGCMAATTTTTHHHPRIDIEV